MLTHTHQQATTSLAASLNLPLNIHFTDPGQPLFIEIETDDLDEPDYPQDEDGEDVDVDDGSSRIWECFFALATVRIEGEGEDEDVGAEAGAGDETASASRSRIVNEAAIGKRDMRKVVERAKTTERGWEREESAVIEKRPSKKSGNRAKSKGGGSQISMRRISTIPPSPARASGSGLGSRSRREQEQESNRDNNGGGRNDHPGNEEIQGQIDHDHFQKFGQADQEEEPLFLPGSQLAPPTSHQQRPLPHTPALSNPSFLRRSRPQTQSQSLRPSMQYQEDRQKGGGQLPSLSQAEQKILQDSGWGDGAMGYDEFEALMGDGGDGGDGGDRMDEEPSGLVSVMVDGQSTPLPKKEREREGKEKGKGRESPRPKPRPRAAAPAKKDENLQMDEADEPTHAEDLHSDEKANSISDSPGSQPPRSDYDGDGDDDETMIPATQMPSMGSVSCLLRCERKALMNICRILDLCSTIEGNFTSLSKLEPPRLLWLHLR